MCLWSLNLLGAEGAQINWIVEDVRVLLATIIALVGFLQLENLLTDRL